MRPSSIRTDSPSNLSDGTALSIVGGTELCSFLNFSKAFLLISSFCRGSVTKTQSPVHQSVKNNGCLTTYGIKRKLIKYLCKPSAALMPFRNYTITKVTSGQA